MVLISNANLTLDNFIKVVRDKEKVKLSSEAIYLINKSNNNIKTILKSNKTVYGVNTGFGKLSDVIIPENELSKLQENLLISHACGVGEPFADEIVRGMMLLRINALSRGYSGIRLEVIEKLIELLNNDIIPIVPSQGSLGASGDLAPLAHMALPLLGLGEVKYKNKVYKTQDLFKRLKIYSLSHLEAKEGLSLINGTQAMTSIGALVIYDSIRLFKLADISLALSMEALFGIKCAFLQQVHEVRGHHGELVSSKNVLNLLEGSKYITIQGEVRTQDPYSLRCASQVHGASLDAILYCFEKIEIEMNAVTDNPLIFSEEEIISGGNFHGQPVALCFDFLKIALAELANISERRLERLVNPALNEGLPPFLVKHPGINSGFMIVQYTAASLVSENKTLAHPASVDSIPSSGNQEDHVSMGTIAARGAKTILENTKRVIAMEILTSIQALDFRDKKQMGRGTNVLYKYIRKHIPFLENDIIMYPYINKAYELIYSSNIIEEIESIIGGLA